MKTYKINEETVQGFLNYLAQRPYAEVVQGIQALQNLEEIKGEGDDGTISNNQP